MKVKSFKVASTLAAQRFVAPNGTAETVAYPGSGAVLPIGITIDTVKDTNQAIPVAMPGEIAPLLFDDTVASGALVASDSSGRGVPHVLAATTTSLTLPAAYGGVNIGPAVALTGTVQNILIMPGLVK